MKTRLILPTFILGIAALLPLEGNSQTSKNDTRLRNLQKLIDRTEERIADAEKKMIMGDSLITNGDRCIAEADKDFFRIAEEVKQMNKEYRVKRKLIYKRTKSENREISMQARTELRKLDEDRRLKVRNYSIEVREMKKKAMKGDSDIRRGQQMQCSAANSLKTFEKNLRETRERYDIAMSTMGN